ncbi:MAG TPA: trypsin-like peptidase domain-containing protein [Bryobacteraceae bacterium]|nr:trypsin-like peptidase domain-containing protein [Bryobacteraceae bacterium]
MLRFESDSASALLSLSHELADSVAQAGQSVVGVRARPRLGSSGIHWFRGVVVTAGHTIERDDEITLELPDGRTVSAELAGYDPRSGLAMLTARGEFPVAVKGDAASLRVGHMVLAVARPSERGLCASWGIISALGGKRGGYIHLDLTMYPGFSGGPLVDAHGRVVGLNTLSPKGAALTIPKATVDRVVGRFIRNGDAALD